MKSPLRRQNRDTRLYWFEALEDRRVLSANLGPGPTPADFWHATDLDTVQQVQGTNYIKASDFELFTLDLEDARSLLSLAPMEFTSQANTRPLVFLVPNPDGLMEHFAVVEAPVMAPELAAQFPDIKTYRGQGISDPAATIRLDVTVQGFHAQVLSPNGPYYVDPYYHLNDSIYMSYYRSDFLATKTRLEDDCGCSNGNDDHGDDSEGHLHFPELLFDSPPLNESEITVGPMALRETSGNLLSTYDLAVAATGEYTQFHGGTVAAGQSAIVTAVNRITGVYENELTVRLMLVANNSSVVFTNPNTDPYSNNNLSSMLSQNQSTLDAVIGSLNYDIGHVFGTGGGGVALLGVVGRSGFKAQGVSSLPNPIGDPFHIDFVSHEMGHQFGANHTFNGDSGSCSGSNRNASTAYEPGSGSTIMAYSGICGNDNLQFNSDPYFHFISHEEIRTYISSGPGFTSATQTSTGNTIPSVNGGPNYVIPDQTPFFLTAVGSDPDSGQVLTYGWEQRDLGPQQDVNAPDNGNSPLFRTWLPTTSPTRYFPRFSDLLNNTTVVGEKYPLTNRNLNFRVTIRDNASGGGGVNSDDVLVIVVNSGSGFSITSQNTSTSWTGLTEQTITWNVSGSNTGTINTPNVDILFAADGLNYETVLASAVPNDGNHTIIVPNVDTNSGRIMVRGTGNIFFDINNANIAVSPSTQGAIFETGVITDLTHAWRTINFTQTYNNPIVIFGPASLNGIDPSWARIRDVTSTGFDVHLTEWEYLNRQHIQETVSYIVIEEGQHTLSDGTVIVAGSTPVTHLWKTINFATPFSTAPIVISSLGSEMGVDQVTTRTRNVSASRFQIQLQEQEAANGLHSPEPVNYFAIAPGLGSTDGLTYEAVITGNSVNHNPFTVNFSQTFSGTPLFFASMQTRIGADPTILRWTDLSSTTATFFLQEEQSFDAEVLHSTEVVGYVAFEFTSSSRFVNNGPGHRLLPPIDRPRLLPGSITWSQDRVIPNLISIGPGSQAETPKLSLLNSEDKSIRQLPQTTRRIEIDNSVDAEIRTLRDRVFSSDLVEELDENVELWRSFDNLPSDAPLNE